MKNIKYISIGVLSILIILGYFQIALANPSNFVPPVTTSSATTSPAYMGIGLATSTLTYDTYRNGNNFITNQMTLLNQFAGSSTASILSIKIEYSQDGIDWFQNNLLPISTTTTNISVANSYLWAYASTTVGTQGLNAANSALATKALLIQTPTRFVRAVYSLTGGAGSIWGEWVPSKEIAQN